MSCCKSEAFFKVRLLRSGGRPVLLTTQLMYPGAFILSAVAAPWSSGAGLPAIRNLAGGTYAANQSISRKSGIGVFSSLKE